MIGKYKMFFCLQTYWILIKEASEIFPRSLMFSGADGGIRTLDLRITSDGCLRLFSHPTNAL